MGRTIACNHTAPYSMNIYVKTFWPWNLRTTIKAILLWIKVITKLPNSEQYYKGKVKTHNYINRQNQSTTENCENRNDPELVQAFLKKWWVESDFCEHPWHCASITLAKPYERSSDSNLIGGLPAEAIFMASGHRHICKVISDMWDCRQSNFIIL